LPNNGNMGMYTLGDVTGPQTYTVQVRRLDDILNELGIISVDFIKMDIEGSELAALKGAVDLLQRCRPPILIELNESALRACGATSHEVKTLLRSFDYKGWIIRRNTLIPITEITQHSCDECLFLYDGDEQSVETASPKAAKLPV
jgi:hypothetical protein